MALWICVACTAAYAVGLPRCPQCGSTDHHEEEEDRVHKISRNGGASYDPGSATAPDSAPDTETAASEPDEGTQAQTAAATPEPKSASPEPAPAPARAPKKAADA